MNKKILIIGYFESDSINIYRKCVVYEKVFSCFSTIKDLISFIERKELIPKDLEGCSRFVSILVGNEWIKPLIDFNLYKFIKINRLNNRVVIRLLYGGVGATGCPIIESVKFEIRPRETNHKLPHIHISNHRNQYGVSISLDGTLSILNGKHNWKNNYNRKIKKEIEKTINTYCEQFRNYYLEMQRGINPKGVAYIFNGVECYLGYTDSRCL